MTPMTLGREVRGAAYVVVLRRSSCSGSRSSRRSSRGSSARSASSPSSPRERPPQMAELLVWPALIAYGEAAVAYAGVLRGTRSLHAPRHLGRPDRLARPDRAARRAGARSDGFPWGTWAGSLNLFVWLVVGAYLIWGCPPRYRLLGLAVMPLAAALLVAARAGGGTRRATRRLRRPLPRAPRRPRARRPSPASRSRRRSRRSTSGGAPAEAARRRHPAPAPAAARVARPRHRRGRSRSRCRPDGRPRRRARQLRRDGELRRADGGHDRHLARSTRPSSSCARDRPHGRRVRVPARRRFVLLVRSSLAGTPLRLRLVARRHLAPRRARRAAGARRAGPLERRSRALAGGARRRPSCLSTCNRTELYLASHEHGPARRTRRGAARARGARAASARARSLYRLHDEAAALHLFRVSAGLDSLVPGEGEILGQVRAAFERGAPGRCSTGSSARRSSRQARARVETAIGESPASVPAAAAALAAAGLRRPRRPHRAARRRRQDRRAGRAATSRSRGASIAYVANRTPGARRAARGPLRRARRHARRDRRRCSATVDVVVTSTSAPGFVLDRGDGVPGAARPPWPAALSSTSPFRATSTRRSPRLDGCFLYDIDDLEAVVARRRWPAVGWRPCAPSRSSPPRPSASASGRLRSTSCPAIASLRARAEEIRAASWRRRRTLGRLPEDERRARRVGDRADRRTSSSTCRRCG